MTPFVGSISEYFDALAGRLEHPTSPVLLTRNGPLETIIREGVQLSNPLFAPI